MWTLGQASLEGSRQAPQVQDESVAGRGCAMKLVSLSISMVEENTSNIVVTSRTVGQMSNCITEQTGRHVVAVMLCFQLKYIVSRCS